MYVRVSETRELGMRAQIFFCARVRPRRESVPQKVCFSTSKKSKKVAKTAFEHVTEGTRCPKHNPTGLKHICKKNAIGLVNTLFDSSQTGKRAPGFFVCPRVYQISLGIKWESCQSSRGTSIW